MTVRSDTVLPWPAAFVQSPRPWQLHLVGNGNDCFVFVLALLDQ